MSQYDSWDYLTNFLKKNIDSFEEKLAAAPYAVKVKRHAERPNLVMFKYSQFESDFTNPIVRCCRGSVYDISPPLVKPYLMPFFKFNNYGENSADPIDWNSALYVRDKLDGSLLKLLKENDGGDLWTTNGSFEIDTQVPELLPAENDENLQPPYTFASLRDYALRGHEEEVKRLPAGWVFMFELTSPYNRVIVPYRQTKLFLLGCRDPQGVERTPEWAAENFALTFETPKIYRFKNIDEVLEWCKSVDTIDVEGVVVQDGNFNRVKIKTEYYRNLFFLKCEDHFSDSHIFESIKMGSIDDALSAWPEIRPRTEEITAEWIGFRTAVKNICKRAQARYRDCQKDYPDPKEAKKHYASFVMGNFQGLSSFLFETVKENPDLDRLFNKIEYRELRSHWIPLVQGLDDV